MNNRAKVEAKLDAVKKSTEKLLKFIQPPFFDKSLKELTLTTDFLELMKTIEATYGEGSKVPSELKVNDVVKAAQEAIESLPVFIEDMTKKIIPVADTVAISIGEKEATFREIGSAFEKASLEFKKFLHPEDLQKLIVSPEEIKTFSPNKLAQLFNETQKLVDGLAEEAKLERKVSKTIEPKNPSDRFEDLETATFTVTTVDQTLNNLMKKLAQFQELGKMFSNTTPVSQVRSTHFAAGDSKRDAKSDAAVSRAPAKRAS